MESFDVQEKSRVEQVSTYNESTHRGLTQADRVIRGIYLLSFFGLMLLTVGYIILVNQSGRPLREGETIQKQWINPQIVSFPQSDLDLPFQLPERILGVSGDLEKWSPRAGKGSSGGVGGNYSYSAQAEKIHFNASKKMVGKFEMNNYARSSIFVEMGYDKSTFQYDISYVKEKAITKIALVIASYPDGETKSQQAKSRINQLLKKFPQLASNPDIEWEVIEQVEGSSSGLAKGLLHGFLIEYST